MPISGGNSGGGGDGGGSPSPMTIIARQADKEYNGGSNVFEEDEVLRFDFEADSLYFVEVFALCDPTTTSGLQMLFANSGNAANFLYAENSGYFLPAVSEFVQFNVVPVGFGGDGGFGPTVAALAMGMWKGYLQTTETGTFMCQFAPEVENESVPLKAGSHIKVTKILTISPL